MPNAGSTQDRRSTTPARKVALDALERIEAHGAYANLVLPKLLSRSGLSERDRRFVTDLVYGTTRMRSACDFLVDRFLSKPPVPRVRSALRLGAYQLAFGGVSPHAAVDETVSVTPRSARGLVNAILRRVAATPPEWPDDATRLSVPPWIVARLTADLGAPRALAALEAMNEPAEATERADGYVQDSASQQVAALVGAGPGERVLDLCAAPGGKATALAAAGAWVVAADIRPSRVGLIRTNVDRLASSSRARSAPSSDPSTRRGPAALGGPFASSAVGAAAGAAGGGLPGSAPDRASSSSGAAGPSAADEGSGAGAPTGGAVVGGAASTKPGVALVAADGTAPPWRPGSFDRVLVDAPCSGLGTLRRRADLRWRVDEATVTRLAELQVSLVSAAADLVRPGGVLVYSVCTLTVAESLAVDDHVAATRPDLVPLDPPGEPWEPWGRGAILLPQVAGTDGMCVFRYRLGDADRA